MTKVSPEQRGYGQAHRARRRGIAPMVEAGIVRCARCGELIRPGEPCDLGTSTGQNGWSTQGQSTAAATGRPSSAAITCSPCSRTRGQRVGTVMEWSTRPARTTSTPIDRKRARDKSRFTR